jgi:hypothetical protein
MMTMTTTTTRKRRKNRKALEGTPMFDYTTILKVGAPLIAVSALAITVHQVGRSIRDSEPDQAWEATADDVTEDLPLYFEENRGQTDPSVGFLSRAKGYTLYLTPTEAVLSLGPKTPPLRLQFLGGATQPEMVGGEPSSYKTNYLIGQDRSQWITNVSTYGKVHYHGVYPGIDAVYYSNNGRLEYDFVVAPGADPSVIRLGFRGADSVALDDGDLVLQTGAGSIRQRKPVAYQEFNGIRHEVDASYVLDERGEVLLALAGYDHGRTLVIDPTLEYSTYLTGGFFGTIEGLAVDVSGNAYVVGSTPAADFPTTQGALQPAVAGDYDGVVTKLNPVGWPVYSTFLGGGREDHALGVRVDAAGNAYVVGQTFSNNFPGTAPGTFHGVADAFVAKLDVAGSNLLYSTYLGGSTGDGGTAIAIDSSAVYVTGSTGSSNFPTTNGAAQPTFGGNTDAFVTKLRRNNGSIVYSTFLGGSGWDAGRGIDVNGSGNAYMVAATQSSNFPIVQGSYDTSLNGFEDAYVAKLNASGTSLVYATYLGGLTIEEPFGIVVDPNGSAYVTGGTWSSDFPTTPGAFQTAFAGSGGGGDGDGDGDGNGTSDAFVTKLNSAGTGLVYSTFLGGSGGEIARSIALDAWQFPHVSGWTNSSDFPTMNPLHGFRGTTDAFVSVLDDSGGDLVFSTYLGGTGASGTGGGGEEARSVAPADPDTVYVAGVTGSVNFPTTPGAFQQSYNPNASYMGFVTKITQVFDATTTGVPDLPPEDSGETSGGTSGGGDGDGDGDPG